MADNIGRTFKEITFADLVCVFKKCTGYSKKVWELFVKQQWYDKDKVINDNELPYYKIKFIRPCHIQALLNNYNHSNNSYNNLNNVDPNPRIFKKYVFNIILKWIFVHLFNEYHGNQIPLPKNENITLSQIIALLKNKMYYFGEKELLPDLMCWKKLMKVEMKLTQIYEKNKSDSNNNNTSDGNIGKQELLNISDELSEWEENQWIIENFNDIAKWQSKYVLLRLNTMSFNQKKMCFEKFSHCIRTSPEIIRKFFAQSN